MEESSAKAALRGALRSLPAIGVSALFIVIGYTKFNDDPASEWVRIFDQIGLGQWFRYVTGAVQIAGGILMAPRRTRTAGALMLATTMLGAAVVDVVILGSPLVIAPLLLLFVIATVWVTSTG